MESYCSLCTLDTIHRLFFVTRLIINKINKVQWVDFKLENVLVSLHSLKTMGIGPFGASAPLFLRNGEFTWTFSYTSDSLQLEYIALGHLTTIYSRLNGVKNCCEMPPKHYQLNKRLNVELNLILSRNNNFY